MKRRQKLWVAKHDEDLLKLVNEYDELTKVDIESELPTSYNLFQNYPNPFNSTTTICFDLPKSTNLKLSIYNIVGKEIETILDGYFQPGKYKAIWNTEGLPSGTYIYKLQTDTFNKSNKMILEK